MHKPDPIERLPDSTLFRLTPGQMRSVRKLVKRCCNYLDGDCLPLDGPCSQTISRSLICRWFRHAVLPDQPKLEQAILNPKKAAPLRDLRQRLPCPFRSGKILPNLRKGCSPQAESKIRP